MSSREPDEARVGVASGGQDGLGGDVAAEVDDGEAVVFQEHLHDVLADVMDVALHRGHDNGAVARGVGGSGSACGGLGVVADEIEAGFDGLGGGHELGQKEHALIVLLADDVENGHEDVVDNGQTVVGLQQTFRGHRHRRAAPFQHAFSQVSDGFHRIGESARHRDGVAAWDPLRRGGLGAASPRGDRARGAGLAATS